MLRNHFKQFLKHQSNYYFGFSSKKYDVIVVGGGFSII